MEQNLNFYYTKATVADSTFMEKILLEAAAASGEFIALEELDQHPDTARYVREWPREREVGVVARTDEGTPVGVAWICLFSHLEEKGPDGLIPPEITIGVLSQYRNLGLGDELLRRLYELAKQQQWQQLSLGVHKDNYSARRLYDKHGWIHPKVFGDYILMIKNLQPFMLSRTNKELVSLYVNNVPSKVVLSGLKLTISPAKKRTEHL